MAAIINKRVSGTTIVETIVALVIILALFGIAVTVVVQVTAQSATSVKLKAAQAINEYALNTARHKSFVSEEIVVDGLAIAKEVSPYRYDNVLAVTFTVYDKNRQILQAEKRLYRFMKQAQ
jgi:hypothetical protein